MKSMMSFRRVRAIVMLAGALAVPAFEVVLSAQTVVPVERISASVVVGVKTVEPIKIELIRWSTDAERTQFLAVLTGKNDTARRETLQKAPSIGYVWGNSSIGSAIRYAERQPLPDGRERLVLIVDRRVSAWQGKQGWEADSKTQDDDLMTVVELRVGKTLSEGKVAPASKVAATDDGKAISVTDYATAPVKLTGIKLERRPEAVKKS